MSGRLRTRLDKLQPQHDRPAEGIFTSGKFWERIAGRSVEFNPSEQSEWDAVWNDYRRKEAEACPIKAVIREVEARAINC
jgi:hypothetical protein